MADFLFGVAFVAMLDVLVVVWVRQRYDLVKKVRKSSGGTGGGGRESKTK